MKLIYLTLALLISFGCARTISDLELKVGDGTDNNVTVTAEIGAGASNPYLRYNTTGDKWEFHDGTSLFDFGSGGGGFPTMAKGSLITSNGTSNGEFDACANGEILEWDSTETAGIKCVTQFNQDEGASTTAVVSITFGGTYVNVPSLTSTITTTGGPVLIKLVSAGTGSSYIGHDADADESRFRLKRGATTLTVETMRNFGGTAQDMRMPCSSLTWYDTPTAGTYTYGMDVTAVDAPFNVTIASCKLIAIEL